MNGFMIELRATTKMIGNPYIDTSVTDLDSKPMSVPSAIKLAKHKKLANPIEKLVF